MKKGLFLISVFCLFTVCFIAATPRDGAAVEKWMVVGSTVWVANGNNLSFTFPSSAPNDLHVTSNSVGDLQWIKTSPLIPYGARIKQVVLCYQTPNAGTLIKDIRLGDYILRTQTVLQDIFPIPASSEGTCYFSPVFDEQPSGSLTISLRLNFASTSDSIMVGTLGFLIDE